MEKIINEIMTSSLTIHEIFERISSAKELFEDVLRIPEDKVRKSKGIEAVRFIIKLMIKSERKLCLDYLAKTFQLCHKLPVPASEVSGTS